MSSEIGPSGYSYQENYTVMDPTPCTEIHEEFLEVNYSPDQLEDAICLKPSKRTVFGENFEGEHKVHYAFYIGIKPC